MIAPFVQYLFAQVFWLGVCWLIIALFLHFFVVPRFMRLRKKREAKLRASQEKLKQLEMRVQTMKQDLQRRREASVKKTRTLVSKARIDGTARIRQVKQEETEALRVFSQSCEENFFVQTKKMKGHVTQAQKELAESFIKNVVQSK